MNLYKENEAKKSFINLIRFQKNLFLLKEDSAKKCINNEH